MRACVNAYIHQSLCCPHTQNMGEDEDSAKCEQVCHSLLCGELAQPYLDADLERPNSGSSSHNEVILFHFKYKIHMRCTFICYLL